MVGIFETLKKKYGSLDDTSSNRTLENLFEQNRSFFKKHLLHTVEICLLVSILFKLLNPKKCF